MICFMGRKVNFVKNNMYLRVINFIKISIKCVILQIIFEFLVLFILYLVCILLKFFGVNFLMIIKFFVLMKNFKIFFLIWRKVFSYFYVNIVIMNLKSFYGDFIIIISFDVIFYQGMYVIVIY